jgi:hypothetical protein
VAEGRRRAAVPGQRVVDVTGHDDLDAAQPRVEAGHVDRVQQAQGGAPRGQVTNVGVEKSHSQRTGHPRAAVGGRTPADAEYDPPDAPVQRGQYQLADAVRGRR